MGLFFMSKISEETLMEEETLKIYQGKTEAFLICDRSFEDCDAPFLAWLRSEGFKLAHHHGNYGCWWIHVNLTRKQYAYGMPGVALVKPIGNHAITIEEFRSIYSIFKKYEGQDLFSFLGGRFDYDTEAENQQDSTRDL